MRPRSPLGPIRIVQLRRDQLLAVGEILENHAESPAFRHTFPDPRRAAPAALRRMFSGIARDALASGSVYEAERLGDSEGAASAHSCP
jgi:hypothetical protein